MTTFIIAAFFAAPFIAMAILSRSTLLHTVGTIHVAVKASKVFGYRGIERVYYILNAAYHDVGKLMIPKSILHKDGGLTEEERKTINTHCNNFVARVYGFFFPAAVGHHKNFLNDGYGFQKVQTESAAFVQFCDMTDALIGFGRMYIPQPRTLEKVKEIMDDSKDKFRPEFVELSEEFFSSYKPSKLLAAIDKRMRAKKAQETEAKEKSKA